MSKITIKKFIKDTGTDEQLFRATVRQLGGWEPAQYSLRECAEHSADAGWPGFTYYWETADFWKRNRADIQNLARKWANDIGVETFEMIKSFRCLNGDYSIEEIADCWYMIRPNDCIMNAMSWFALESMANAFDDYCYGEWI